MDTIAKSIQQSSKLHISAKKALRIGDFKLAETLYRAAIERVTTLLDPLHTDYVDMLKGLRTSLSQQSKAKEVAKVDLIIGQLCLGQ